MVNRLFRYFTSARFPKALELGKTLSEQTLPPRELSFVIFTGALSELFQGRDPQVEPANNWMSTAIGKLQEQKAPPNDFLVLLMAYEGSKLFVSHPEEGLAMLNQAQNLASNPAQSAGVLFFRGIFEMNRTEDYQAALVLLLQARKGLEKNQEFSLFSFLRYWNETMIAHLSNQLGSFKDSDTLSRQILLHCRNLGFEPLLENCYLNLAFSNQGLENVEQTLYYLNKNLQYWEKRKNPYKQGLALVMSAVLMLQMDQKEKGLDFIKQRKEMDYAVESHWAMIERALTDSGLEEEAKSWVWTSPKK